VARLGARCPGRPPGLRGVAGRGRAGLPGGDGLRRPRRRLAARGVRL